MNQYQIIRNIALIGAVVGAINCASSYSTWKEHLAVFDNFEKSHPSCKKVVDAEKLEFKIMKLEQSIEEVGDARVDVWENKDFRDKFNQTKRDYLANLQKNILELKKQREDLVSSLEYLQIKPRYDWEHKKLTRPINDLIWSGLLLEGSLLGLGFNYLLNRKEKKSK